MTLSGRTILVTGAASGIGRLMALGCLDAGADVFLSDRASLEDILQESRDRPGRAAALTADLARPGAADRIYDAACAAFSRIDVLINNAGIGVGSVRPNFVEDPLCFWQADEEDFRRFAQVNMLSPIRLASLAVPAMIARGWGRIINVTTSLSTMLMAGQAPYGASKAGLEAVTAVMAGDLQGTGVTANVLIPGGPTFTPMTMCMGIAAEDMIAADCMVAPALWLSSEASDGVTGKRFLGCAWDSSAPPAEAAEAAGDVVAWTGYGRQAIWSTNAKGAQTCP